jgi:hypothetical protein
LSEYKENLYFIDESTNIIKYFPLDTLVVSTYYSWSPASVGECGGAGYGVYSSAIDLSGFYNYYQNTANNGRGSALMKYNGTLSQVFTGGCSNDASSPHTSTIFLTSNYIYANYRNPGSISSASQERIYYKNGSLKSTDFYISPLLNSNGAYLGGYTTIVLYASSATAYNIFDFIEPGILNNFVPTGYNAPALAYQTGWVRSQYSTYFNNSQFTINYNLNFSTLYTDYDLSIFQSNVLKYTYRVDLINANGAHVGTYPIPVLCENAGAIDIVLYPSKLYNCRSAGTFNFNTASHWDNGTYSVYLIERTTSTGADALLSSDSFTVSNTTGTLAGSSTVPGQGGSIVSTGNPTMDNIINFLQMPAFWGILIFVFVVIAVAWKAPAAVGIVALIISNLEAIIGLWAPYTIYVFIVTWIIAAIFFTLGRDTTTGGNK